jgi:CspA family cold shock protein
MGTSGLPLGLFSREALRLPIRTPHLSASLGLWKGVAHMATGKVKWFNDQKGFGFISTEAGKDVFVHHTVIEGTGFKTLEDGESVEYEYEDGPKGAKATRVRRLAAAAK